MSILEEVLSSSEKVEISAVLTGTADIARLVAVRKRDLLKYLEEVYVKYSQPLRKNANFCNKLREMTVDISKLETNIKQITVRDIESAEKKIALCRKSFAEAEVGLDISNRLIDIHEKLVTAKTLLKDEEFVRIIQLILEMDENVDNLRDKYQLEVLNGILNEVALLKRKVFTNMKNIFDELVKYYTERNTTYFKIIANKLGEILSAYGLTQEVDTPLNDITKFMWDHIFSPLVYCKVSVKTYTFDNENILELEIISDKHTNYYKDVFENFKTVLDYFESNFNYPLTHDLSSLQYIGGDLQDNLSELLIKKCLIGTVPKNSEELQKYDVIAGEIEELQQKLISSGIFSGNMTCLTEYAKNVDVHFINNKCDLYLMTAVKLMKRDLHEMVEVGTPPDLDNPFKFNDGTFQQRSVSKSCIDLADFAEKIMQKITDGSPAGAKRLYRTVQEIFNQYPEVVSEHHQKLLQTIPQQVALFHNNCVFLAFKLTTWNQNDSSQICGLIDIEPPIFGSEIRMLGDVGNKVFASFLEQQIQQIEQIMKEAGLTNTTSLQELEPSTEKCIRQCLRQQELLKTVWNKVLSYSDYNTSLGMTLDFLCNFIINAVIKYEDLSSEAAQNLVDVLKVIITRGPKLFTDSKDVFVFVKNWYKLNELVFVLSSSLVDIGDRWADGKGPLALQFKAEELRQLIRALFQNTARRDAILARITQFR